MIRGLIRLMYGHADARAHRLWPVEAPDRPAEVSADPPARAPSAGFTSREPR